MQLFYSFFKTLVGQAVTVELKNDMAITGVLVSVDQFLNIKLENIKVVDEERFPHMVRPRGGRGESILQKGAKEEEGGGISTRTETNTYMDYHGTQGIGFLSINHESCR